MSDSVRDRPSVGGGLLAELATRNTASPLFWWSAYHHLVAHNLLFAVLFSLAAAAITRRALLGAVVFGSVNLTSFAISRARAVPMATNGRHHRKPQGIQGIRGTCPCDGLATCYGKMRMSGAMRSSRR
jgi:hypothetical protein